VIATDESAAGPSMPIASSTSLASPPNDERIVTGARSSTAMPSAHQAELAQ